jgi:hypothetical protein
MTVGWRDLVSEMIEHETAARTVPPHARAGHAPAAHRLG